ncbi:STAS domain-containing protein [Amycolatopsis sp. H20-H5]|uniref:STAS domain-containing protein n=1 Tax=Amycolatopsis sp. H20-H5 TaxID=3046309 RepID=UPI002DBE2D50|nr:STAS domain-containing protein [Amycolatopsis sp. H20-H5]MEC3980927.1 STAS domain-containing protein [Amycolatopsis sp. H20-H5]
MTDAPLPAPLPAAGPPRPKFGGLAVRTRRDDDAVIVSLTGDIDLATAPELRKAAEEALRDRPRLLVLDLADVEFLASAGLAVLLAIQAQAEGVVRVVAASRATLRPIELTGLDRQLAMFDSVEAALAG